MRDVKEPEIRRAEIMDAAMLLFIEQGYTNTTTQDIVDKVNISRGLLYYHFKNKEDILYCLVEQYSDKLLKDIHVIVYDEGKTAIEKIRVRTSTAACRTTSSWTPTARSRRGSSRFTRTASARATTPIEDRKSVV